jgi:hypothetical protein
MNVVSCAAPQGMIEPAPLTSMALAEADDSAQLDAFWAADDRYYVRAESQGGVRWYCLDADSLPAEPSEAAVAAGQMMTSIIPMGGGRVAFPVGSTGRTVFRVWRSRRGGDRPARTRILAVRAARSRRLPA